MAVAAAGMAASLVPPISSASIRTCHAADQLRLQPRGLHRHRPTRTGSESPQPAVPRPAAIQGRRSAEAGRQDPDGRLLRAAGTPDRHHRAAQAAVAADRPFHGRRGRHGPARDVWMGHQHHHGHGRGDEGVGRLRALPPRGAGPGDGHRRRWRRFRCPLRWASPTPRRAGWPPGAPGRWSRATPWRRSPTRNTRTPTNGGRWPKPTTSTIRCGSSPVRC